VKQEFTLMLDNVEYPVAADGEAIIVNGRPFTVEVTDDGAVLVDSIAYDVALEGETATVDGASYTVQISGLAVTPAAAVVAPAAPVVEAAGAGAGDPVCVLEAMKMENELRARQSGTVHAVHVKPGDDVEKDQVLVEVE